MGLFDSMGGGLGIGLLGLGLGGDIFNAYSQQQAAQRQRDLYKQMQDPNYVMGRANQYYGQNMNQLRQALPQLERQSINPEIGQRGISGGAAQSLYDQTVAQYQQQAWQQALQAAQGGMQGAGNFVGQPAGTGGGTAGWLQSMLLMQALQGRQPGAQVGTDTTNLTAPNTSYGTLPMSGYGGGVNPVGLPGGAGSTLSPQLDFGVGSNPFTSTSVFGAY